MIIRRRSITEKNGTKFERRTFRILAASVTGPAMEGVQKGSDSSSSSDSQHERQLSHPFMHSFLRASQAIHHTEESLQERVQESDAHLRAMSPNPPPQYISSLFEPASMKIDPPESTQHHEASQNNEVKYTGNPRLNVFARSKMLPNTVMRCVSPSSETLFPTREVPELDHGRNLPEMQPGVVFPIQRPGGSPNLLSVDRAVRAPATGFSRPEGRRSCETARYWDTVMGPSGEPPGASSRPWSVPFILNNDTPFEVSAVQEVQHTCPDRALTYALSKYESPSSSSNFYMLSGQPRYAFSNEGTDEVHRTRDHSQELAFCEECGRAFRSKTLLALHVQKGHVGRGTYPCKYPGCDKIYRYQTSLYKHAKRHHGGSHA